MPSQQQPFLPPFIDIEAVGLAHIPFPDLPQHPAAMAGVSERARSAAVVITRRFIFVLLVGSVSVRRSERVGSAYLACFLSQASISEISFSCSSTIFWAIALVSGSLTCFKATLAMAMAPLWCGIMCVRKSTSGSPV